MRSAPIRIAILALVAACVGCPANLEDPERFSLDAALSCPDVPQDVLAKDCGTPGCHSTVDKMLGLDLQAPDVASRLVGVHAMGGPGLLIDPSNPAMSIVYEKLMPMPPFGLQMPYNEKPLDAATIACVLQWITTASAQTADDGGDDAGAPPPDDAGSDDAGSDDAGSGGDATTPDAGKPPPDAGTVKPKDAAAPEASAPVVDAAAPTDAKAD
jgi:hypothetical protein